MIDVGIYFVALCVFVCLTLIFKQLKQVIMSRFDRESVYCFCADRFNYCISHNIASLKILIDAIVHGLRALDLRPCAAALTRISPRLSALIEFEFYLRIAFSSGTFAVISTFDFSYQEVLEFVAYWFYRRSIRAYR